MTADKDKLKADLANTSTRLVIGAAIAHAMPECR